MVVSLNVASRLSFFFFFLFLKKQQGKWQEDRKSKKKGQAKTCKAQTFLILSSLSSTRPLVFARIKILFVISSSEQSKKSTM